MNKHKFLKWVLLGKNFLSKRNWTAIGSFATIFMVIATLWMAQSTKDLTTVELKPYISPYDIRLEWVDKTGTPVRWWSLSGENIGNKKIEDPERIVMSVRFFNSGKKGGFIKVNKICNKYGEKIYEDDKELLFVPGLSSNSGNLLGIDINNHSKEGYDYYSYDLTVSSDYFHNFNDSVTFTIKCEKNSVTCWFIKYKDYCPPLPLQYWPSYNSLSTPSLIQLFNNSTI